jgi:hypothetical protein
MNPGTLLLLTGLSLLPLATAAAWGDDLTARTTLSLKTPRSRDPVLGGSRDKVFFSVWVPDGIKVVRGAVCNPFSKDEGVSKHWKAACRHWQFAYLQTDLDAVEKDAFLALFKAALPELAKKSGHPEVEHMPLCFIGMSRGGGMSTQLAELMPERTLAAVPVCLEVGPTSEAGRRIPILTVFGEKDGKQMEKLLGHCSAVEPSPRVRPCQEPGVRLLRRRHPRTPAGRDRRQGTGTVEGRPAGGRLAGCPNGLGQGRAAARHRTLEDLRRTREGVLVPLAADRRRLAGVRGGER